MTAPNKNEGLIARLNALHRKTEPDVIQLAGEYVNPDGPEAARAIQDLEEEVGRYRDLLFRLENERKREDVRACHLKRAIAVAWSEALASPIDGEK